jgi:hypothetical protein
MGAAAVGVPVGFAVSGAVEGGSREGDVLTEVEDRTP